MMSSIVKPGLKKAPLFFQPDATTGMNSSCSVRYSIDSLRLSILHQPLNQDYVLREHRRLLFLTLIFSWFQYFREYSKLMLGMLVHFSFQIPWNEYFYYRSNIERIPWSLLTANVSGYIIFVLFCLQISFASTGSVFSSAIRSVYQEI